MNIVQLNNFIEKIVSCTETVKSFYTNSVYECWNTEEVKYGSISFCITKTQMRERTMTYDAIIYYGDRLLEDKSNRNAIWSDAAQVIQSIIGTVNSIDGEITISYPYNLTLFEQKFADELAGAYAEISIEVEGIGECGDLLYGYENEEGVKLESVVKTFTINGEYDIVPSDGFDAISDVKVIVDVPIQSKSVEFNSNGTHNIAPDSGYVAMDNVEVNVNIPLQNKSVEFNSNGVHNVTPDSGYIAMDNVAVNVNIPLQGKSVIYSEAGDYQVTPDPGYEALSRVDVKVSLEGKTEIPNGFRFTGGDMSLVEWDKYDWSMVYDATEFFKGCSSSDPNWFDRFKSGFNGRLMSCEYIFDSFRFNPTGYEGVGIDFTGIDTSNVVSYKYAFMSSNGKMGPYFVRGLDTSNAVIFDGMFYNCGNLTELPYLDTSRGIIFNRMFSNCSKLIKLPHLDTSNAYYLQHLFAGCSSLISIPELDISNVRDMSCAFENCTKLMEVRLKGDPSKLTIIVDMFRNVKTNGTLYYDSRYDYSKIINILPSTWTSVPYDVLN